MSPRSIREYADTIRPRYLQASWREKGRILQEACRVTGYHRKAVIRLLHRPSRPPRTRRGRPRQYDHRVVDALRRVWEAGDFLCSKRLAPFLPEFVAALERHRELALPPAIRDRLVRISPATIDRLLNPFRRAGRRQPHSGHPSTAALRAQIPLRTFGEWRHVQPGAVQADLVAHCGESTAGFHLYSLVAVDVATGWTECQAVWGRSYHRVVSALDFIRRRLPFPLRELHTDNGGEFLNTILLPWCRRYGIRLTRGRPYRKNDQAHVEQRAWTAVRRLVGYDRYSSRGAYETLQQFYVAARQYLNFFQPIAKLRTRTRVGAKVIKRYDRAQTPAHRLLAAKVLTPPPRSTLDATYRGLNPVALRQAMQTNLQALWKQADRPPQVTPTLRQRSLK